MEISTYKAGSNLPISFYFYHATGKSTEISMYKAGRIYLLKCMEISMYKAGIKIFYFSHASGKSMEISMCKGRANHLSSSTFTMLLVNPWKFLCTRLE